MEGSSRTGGWRSAADWPEETAAADEEDEGLLGVAETLLCGEPLREETAVPGRLLLGRLTTVVEPWARARDASGGATERWVVCSGMMLRASLRPGTTSW